MWVAYIIPVMLFHGWALSSSSGFASYRLGTCSNDAMLVTSDVSSSPFYGLANAESYLFFAALVLVSFVVRRVRGQRMAPFPEFDGQDALWFTGTGMVLCCAWLFCSLWFEPYACIGTSSLQLHRAPFGKRASITPWSKIEGAALWCHSVKGGTKVTVTFTSRSNEKVAVSESPNDEALVALANTMQDQGLWSQGVNEGCSADLVEFRARDE